MALNPPPKPNRRLAVFVRYPEPGKVKTRLANVYGDSFAAELYGYFVDDLLETLAPGSYQLEIFFTPAEREIEIRQRFGRRFRYTPQEGEGLGDRMKNAFRSCFAQGFASALLIGSDSPDLTAEIVEQAFQPLESGQGAVVGPAFDGGYYLIGFRSDTFEPAVFNEIPWGENSVFEITRTRLRNRGYRLHESPAWHDIDTEKDLADLQARHGNTAFSRSRTMDFLRKWRGGFHKGSGLPFEQFTAASKALRIG
ncbi:MAG: TIGR04282 family arsenosugar biosynthesis glycosyltransferase [Syntrophobacterales bacterium]|nr:TIGR04282 family arsenosugar biosynthesis glycosyltransferase [Syntrophobacterales bacterium]